MTSLNKEKRILIFNKYYSPGFRAGGPIKSLVNLVECLGNYFDFFVVTLNHDAGVFQSYKGIKTNSWERVGKAQVKYLDPRRVSLSTVIANVQEINPNIIYLNSFFDSTFTQRVLWAKRLKYFKNVPIIIAPRGEFSAGALNLKKFKKKLFLKLTGVLELYHHLIWQASSSHEHDEILRNLGFVSSDDIFVAQNLVQVDNLPKKFYSYYFINNQLRICFLSRISPKKNLDFALMVLAKVKVNILFTIYGPKEDNSYWAKCESIVSTMPTNIQVTYEGEIHPNEIIKELTRHDLFFFPTLGENYGHVIHEALCAGLPVLTSDQTPWKGLEGEGVGWTLPLDRTESFVRKIESFAALEPHKVVEIRNRACKYGRGIALNPDVLQTNINMYNRVIAKSFV